MSVSVALSLSKSNTHLAAELPPEIFSQILRHCDAHSAENLVKTGLPNVSRGMEMTGAKKDVLSIPLFQNQKSYPISKESTKVVIFRHLVDDKSTLASDLNLFANAAPNEKEAILRRYAKKGDFEALLIFEKTFQAFGNYCRQLPNWASTALNNSFKTEKGCKFAGYLYKKYTQKHHDFGEKTAPPVGSIELKNLVKYGDLSINDLNRMQRSDPAILQKFSQRLPCYLNIAALIGLGSAGVCLGGAGVLLCLGIYLAIPLMMINFYMCGLIIGGAIVGLVLSAALLGAFSGLLGFGSYLAGLSRPAIPESLPVDHPSDTVDA